MKILFRLILLAVVLAIGWWAWTALFPDPRNQVRHRLDKLVALASYPTTEGTAAKVIAMNKMSGFFSEQVEVLVDASGYPQFRCNNRADLIQMILAARTTVSTIQARILDPRIEIAPGNEAAIVDLSLQADVGGEKNAVLQEFKFNLKKSGGDWIITRIESVKSLR